MKEERSAIPAASRGEHVSIPKGELVDALGAWTTFADRLFRDLLERSTDKPRTIAYLRGAARDIDLAVCAVTRDTLLREHAQQVSEIVTKVAYERKDRSLLGRRERRKPSQT